MLPIKIDLPENFLAEEVRCGYTVSTEFKKLWAVELDLLAEFDRVCKKHNLTYFASGGTLIGAVRHRGFIPWDDDIDLLLPRKDYDKLIEIANEEFRHPYFFQHMSTDCGLIIGGSRLRNSNTVICNESEWKKSFENKGIFIDIFAVDNVPDSELILNLTKLVLKAYWRILRFASYYELYFETGKRYPIGKRIKGYCALKLKHIFGLQTLYQGYEKICTRYSGRKTKRVAPIETLRGLLIYPKECVASTTYVPFEHIQIPIPNGYDEMLTAQYGDYMTMKKVPSIHQALAFNAEIPYKEYEKIRLNKECSSDE